MNHNRFFPKTDAVGFTPSHDRTAWLKGGTCDHCGGRLFQREDDHPEFLRVRMEAYQDSTKPLIDFYQQRNLLINISAEGTPEAIYKRTRFSFLAR